MKMLGIISFVGLMLSVSAIVYTTMKYSVLFQNAKAIEALELDDAVLPKIFDMLEEHKNREFIVKVLKDRRDMHVSLLAAMSKMSADAKEEAVFEMLLWIVAGALFAVLLNGIKLPRKIKEPTP